MKLGPGRVYVKLSRLDLDMLDRIGVTTGECRGQVARRFIEDRLFRMYNNDLGLWAWRHNHELELNRRLMDERTTDW